MSAKSLTRRNIAIGLNPHTAHNTPATFFHTLLDFLKHIGVNPVVTVDETKIVCAGSFNPFSPGGYEAAVGFVDCDDAIVLCGIFITLCGTYAVCGAVVDQKDIF